MAINPRSCHSSRRHGSCPPPAAASLRGLAHRGSGAAPILRCRRGRGRLQICWGLLQCWSKRPQVLTSPGWLRRRRGYSSWGAQWGPHHLGPASAPWQGCGPGDSKRVPVSAGMAAMAHHVDASLGASLAWLLRDSANPWMPLLHIASGLLCVLRPSRGARRSRMSSALGAECSAYGKKMASLPNAFATDVRRCQALRALCTRSEAAEPRRRMRATWRGTAGSEGGAVDALSVNAIASEVVRALLLPLSRARGRQRGGWRRSASSLSGHTHTHTQASLFRSNFGSSHSNGSRGLGTPLPVR